MQVQEQSRRSLVGACSGAWARPDRMNRPAGPFAECYDVGGGPDLADAEDGHRRREVGCSYQVPDAGLAQAQQFDQLAQGENCRRLHGADLTTCLTDRLGQCSNRALPQTGTRSLPVDR